MPPHDKSMVVCLGPGGVGKTSITAALAIRAAGEGRKTLAFTIDPAKRLANAIGMSEVKTGDIVHVEDNFDILMLDVKGTWERVVKKYSKSAEQFYRIRNNRFFDYLSDNFPGFNEYIAVEKIHELITENRYDLIIIDTPPTSYAMSFLEAPSRVLNVLDLNFVKLFLHPYLKFGRFTLRYTLQKEFFILRQLAKFTGIDMLKELASFIFEFDGMFQGFRERAEMVRNRLKSGDTTFLIVTSTDHRRLDEAHQTRLNLEESGYPFFGYIINRCCWMCTGTEIPCRFLSLKPGESDFTRRASAAGLDEPLAQKLFRNLDEHLAVQRKIFSEIRKLCRDSGAGKPCIVTPSFPEDIHNLEGLHRLADKFIPLKSGC